jgi:hypothetical protein
MMGGSISNFRFLDLPGEIRNQIYEELLDVELNKTPIDEGYWKYNHYLGILSVSKQVHAEAKDVFRKINVFCKLETPWAESQDHIHHRGRVSFLATGDKAQRFTEHHLEIAIDLPQVSMGSNATMLLTLQQLPKFTKMWFHSDLDRRGLNQLLCLVLRLRNPRFLAGSMDEEMLPKKLQQELMSPFGMVKELNSVSVVGKHYTSVQKAMKEAMAIPYDPPDVYLDRCSTLKDLGNEQLKAGNPKRALELYFEAFGAMHIIVAGRTRDIWADAYYDRTICTGTFKDQSGSIVRMVLRIRLVANVIFALLKLHDYHEARFWGMRSIMYMRGALGEGADEPRTNFPAGVEWGKVYYRTGVACRELGLIPDAKSLIGIAARWLPGDEVVRRDAEALNM